MTVAFVASGVILWWLARRRAAEFARRHDADQEYIDVLAVMVAGLDAGLHPLDAVATRVAMSGAGRETGAAAVSGSAAEVTARWLQGRPATECLGAFADRFGDRGARLAEIVGAHLTDGQPLAEAVARLQREIDAACRRDTEQRVRELPVRLAAPLVLCILPSFVLASMLPLAAYTRNTLRGGYDFIGNRPVDDQFSGGRIIGAEEDRS